MTELPLHIQLAIETDLRLIQRGEIDAFKSLVSLLQRFPELQLKPERGLAHPLAKIILETKDGRRLAEELGL